MLHLAAAPLRFASNVGFWTDLPIRHDNAERGIPHYMNMQCRRKTQRCNIERGVRRRTVHASTDCRGNRSGVNRSNDTIQQGQQRVCVDRLFEKT